MTVNPGWGGQPFIASSPDKVAPPAPSSRPRRCSRSTAASTPTTAGPVADAGATLFVAGSAIFGADDPAAAYREIAAAAGRRVASLSAPRGSAPAPGR